MNGYRRGISLLEVLMAIFIVSIGLLGVLALIPLATHLTEGGLQADRSATFGQMAVRDFEVREMNDSAKWLNSDGSVAGTGAAQPTGPRMYLLDARGVGHGVSAAFPAGGFYTSVPRITLDSGIGSRMNINVADEVFCTHDDVRYEWNEATQRLEPVMEPGKKFADRDYSWMATLVNELGQNNQYTLSVVVLRSRNLPQAADEFELSVTAMPGGGMAGGEVVLQSVAATDGHLQGLRQGHWLALSRAERLRWYKVIAVGEFDSSTHTRPVTLHGPDWGTTGAYGTPYAIGLKGVVSVYERTVVIH